MSSEVLEKFISDYMKLNLPVSNFAWQGGEPALMGLDFYKKAADLQKKFGSQPNHFTINSFQTNATLLDDDWCKFLSQSNWLVGISLDGPSRFHDYYRLDKTGKPTCSRVISAIEKCREHNVQFNILTLLNDRNVAEPDEIFDFFMDNKIKYLQFIPCVERDASTHKIASFSVTA